MPQVDPATLALLKDHERQNNYQWTEAEERTIAALDDCARRGVKVLVRCLKCHGVVTNLAPRGGALDDGGVPAVRVVEAARKQAGFWGDPRSVGTVNGPLGFWLKRTMGFACQRRVRGRRCGYARRVQMDRLVDAFLAAEQAGRRELLLGRDV
jgi:hypothetical protein